MENKNEGWTSEYYDIVSFYYWEPQLLNRQNKRDPKKSHTDVIARIKRLEVPLNHILNIFFALTPNSLQQRFFGTLVDTNLIRDVFEIAGRVKRETQPASSICQPDFIFESDNSLVGIEIKVNSSTSLDQIIKYAIYQTTYKNDNMKTKQNYLLLLNQSKEHLFKEKLTFESINSELINHEFSNSILAWMKRNEVRQGQHWKREDAIAAVNNLKIGYCSYSAFHDFLTIEMANLTDTPGDITLKNLIKGVVNEFEDRKLL